MSTDLAQFGVQPPVSLRCPVCSTELVGKPVVRCATCDTPAHAECREYVGGCARFACSEAATPRKRLAEVIRLVHSEMLLTHGVYAFGMLALVAMWPLLLVGFAPFLLWQCVSLFRAVLHRRRAHANATQGELAAELRYLLVHHPLKLFRPAREPEAPTAFGTFHYWLNRTLSVAVGTALMHLALGVSRDPIMTFAEYSFFALWFAFMITLFAHPRRMLEFQQERRLHQAGKVFHAWRDEFLAAPVRSETALLEEKKQAGKG